MNDSGDSSGGPKPLDESKKEALRLKLKGLKKLPSPSSMPKPASSAPIIEDPIEAGIEELSASELIEDEPGEVGNRFGLADLGVNPGSATAPAVLSTIDPINLEPIPESEEDFEDEATQMAEGFAFDEDRRPSEGLEEVSSEFDSVSSSEPSFSTSVEDNASSSIDLVRSTASGFQSQAPLPAPIQAAPVVGSAPLPAPIQSQAPLPSPIQSPLDDDDEGFQSQKTELLNSPFESDGLVAKLRVMEGPELGKEYLLSSARNTIGRGDMNSIMVADAAMSRQHIEVLINPDDTYTVRDLQSVNGSTLNGTRIRESDLFHGDRIAAGKTTFQFMLQGDVPPVSRNRKLVPAAVSTLAGKTALHEVGLPPAQPQAANNNKMLVYVGVIAFVLILVVAGGAIFVLKNKSDAPKDQTQAAGKLYLDGVEAIKLREWDQAKVRFSKAKTLDPKLVVSSQLDRISNEVAALKALNAAKDLHADGKLEAAMSRAQAIPKTSVYYEESRSLSQKKKSVEVDSMYAQAQDKVTEDDFEGARDLIGEIRKKVPNHQGASDLEEKLKRLELEQETDRLEKDVRIARKEQQELEALAPRDRNRSPKPTSGSKRVINFTKGYGLYRDKKFDAAIKFFNDVERKSTGPGSKRAAKTASEIGAFKKSYKSAKMAYATKSWAKAEKLLIQARRTDSSISGGKGYFGPELTGLLAGVKGSLGLEALKRKDYAKAAKLQKEGARYSKNDDAVRKLSKSLQAEARNLYVKAANTRKTDARTTSKLCRQIMSMVPKSDGSYKKAKKLLSEL